ncbi:beta barrel domain-containing protein [Rhodococcus sp. NPDC003994]
MTAARFTVGQAVVISGGRRGSHETTIHRVGRKYVYANDHGLEVQFHKNTGIETTTYGYKRELRTPAEHDEDVRRARMLRELRERHGITSLWNNRPYSTDGLTAVLSVLDIDLERDKT